MRDATNSIKIHANPTLLGFVVAMVIAVVAGSMVLAADAAPATAPAAALPSLDEVVAGLPRFSVAGKIVVDDDNKPVEGADVWLFYDHGLDGPRNRVVARTNSDSNGAFCFDNAAVWEPRPPEQRRREEPAKYYVIAAHPQHGFEFVVILPGDKTDDLSIRLYPMKRYSLTAVDENGKPLAGVKAYLMSAQHVQVVETALGSDRQRRYLILRQDIGLATGITGEDGKVEVRGPRRGASFGFAKPGYAPNYGDTKTPAIMFPSASVSGRVTYEDGTPAAGAAVFLQYQGERLARDDFAIADAQGQYELPDVPASGYRHSSMAPDSQTDVAGTVSLKAQDLRPGSSMMGKHAAMPIKPGDRLTQDLVLARACVLAGKVLDLTTGRPVPNIRLDRYIEIEGQRYLDSATVTTDAQGQFRVLVPPGSQVSMQWDDRQDDCLLDQTWLNSNRQPLGRQRITANRTDLVFKLKLRPVQTLSGRVLDDKGQAVKGATIYMIPEAPTPRTDAGGAFTLNVAPTDADFDLCAVSSDKKHAGVVHLKAGATDATITLQPTRDYEGQVVNTEGLPAGNLSFYVDPVLGGERNYRLQQQVQADASGKFKLEKLIPGLTYRAGWSSDSETNRDYDYGEATIELAKLQPDQPITIQAKQYINALMGKVVNEQDQPIPGATVDTGQSELQPKDLRYNRSNVTTDKNGEFTLERLAPGEITLRISAAGYKTGTFRAPTDGIDFKAVLKPVGTTSQCTVTVVDQDGKPIADAPVVLLRRDQSKPAAQTARTEQKTDATGRTLFIVPAGKDEARFFSLVCCDLPGHDLAIARVMPNEDAVIRLVARPSGQHWRGVVTDGAGKPLPGATVRVSSLIPDPSDLRNHVSLPDWACDELGLVCTTDKDGRFELSRCARNWTNVHISATGYAANNSYFDPRRDTSADEKSFALEPGTIVKGRIVFPVTPQVSPVENEVVVYFQDTDASRGGGGLAKVAPDWTFTCDELKPGSYRTFVYIRQKELRKYICPSPPTFEAVMGKPVELILNMEEGIPLRGKLTQAGQPVKATVAATLKGDQYTRSSDDEAGDDGSWIVYLPREGEYELRYYIQAKGGWVNFTTIKVEKGRELEEIVIEVDEQAK